MNGNVPAATRLGMVRCEHCQRQFNPHSAARHIPWCKKQQSDAKKRRLTADKLEALERYRWRIGYKPTNKINQRSQARPFEDEEEEHNNGDSRHNMTRGNQNNNNNNNYVSKSRNPSSVNSSATLSSPSASSLTSLSASISSANGQQTSAPPGRQNQVAVGSATGSRRPSRAETNKAANLREKLKRSASSVTLTKQRCTGSASSRNSRISTTTTCLGKLELDESKDGHEERDTFALSKRQTQMRAKSVSDLTSMGEIVETLAKKMEQIYAQNQLLLETIMRTKQMNGSAKNLNSCDSNDEIRQHQARKDEHGDDGDDQEYEDDDEVEFAQCHHCRARCSIEANYCHKCGCKMRPSNPTPPPPPD